MEKKLELAIKYLMASIGRGEYCEWCEDWFADGHFEHAHLHIESSHRPTE